MRSLILILIVLLCPAAARALTADELLLVVNKNEPKGMELAQFYAKQRNVPAGRIVEVDVPPWNEIDFYTYENAVAKPVRQFIHEQKLQSQVKCLVTFYGMPLRVLSHDKATAAEQAELDQITARLAAAEQSLKDNMTAAGALVERLAPSDVPKDLPPDPALRAGMLLTVAGRAAERLSDVTQREKSMGDVMDLAEVLVADVGTLQRLRTINAPPSTRPAAAMGSLALEQDLLAAKGKFEAAVDDRMNEAARADARQLAARFGLAAEINVLRWQQQNLTPGNTLAALDSELSLVMIPGYPRANWANNLLRHGQPARQGGPPCFMVSRIDAPTPELTKVLIVTSMSVEMKGLKGCVVIDSGKGKGESNPAFKQFDASLESLAKLVQTKTKLSLVLDTSPALMPKFTAKNAALYCGWYSLRAYVPPANFMPGAVGYHIASLELMTLHDDKETGWCHGLLSDGASGTFGAVGEPYLHSFPLPNEFFPLLMTGRLTLAEVYWKTSPLSSWMQALVGDPLYTPYKVNPPLAVGDLPAGLQDALVP